MKKILAIVILMLIFAVAGFAQERQKEAVMAPAPPFTYQGKLTVGGSAANGLHDFIIRVYKEPEDGDFEAERVIENVPVVNGIFTLQLDFDTIVFQRLDTAYLDIQVRPAGGEYTPLTPRQQIGSQPYAKIADNAREADSLNCTNCITNGHISNNSISPDKIAGVVPVNKGGTGSGTKNFVDLSTDQSVAGNKTFTGNVSSGGVFSGNGSGLTDLPAGSITGTINTTQLAPETLPNSSQAKLLGMLRWDVLKPENTFAVGSNPQSIAFDGTHMWVANSNSNNVTKLRASDGLVVGTYPVGMLPTGIAFDGTNIWVVNRNSQNVTKLRASDGFLVGTYSTAGGPTAIAFDGTHIWVANNLSGSVTKLRASDGSPVGTYPAGTFPQYIAFDGTNIWVVASGSLRKLKASDGSIISAIGIISPSGIVFDGTHIWVITQNGNSITKVKTSDLSGVATFTVGGPANAIGFDGTHIWVGYVNTNGNVAKLRASDGSIIGTYPVGTSPRGIAFDGTNIWVTNGGDGTVTRLAPAFPEP